MSYLEMLRPVPGLNVLVTAGASGIGAGIVAGFVEAGANVAICDIDAGAIEKLSVAYPAVTAMVVDVSDAEAVGRMFDTLEERFGHLDVLVNNAGISGPTGALETLELDDIRRTFDVDLMGQFIVLRRAATMLKKRGDGVIINISSVAGRLGYGMRTPYAASKWGIIGLTASLAKEMGPAGIRVNAVLPGVVQGKRMNNVIRARAEAAGVSFDEMEQEYLSKISLRRMVTPEDIAATVLFLCAPAGANISGQAISVCGNVETL